MKRVRSRIRRVMWSCLVVFAWSVAVANGRSDDETRAGSTSRSIAEVLALSGEQLAAEVPVRVQGVVTLAADAVVIQEGDRAIWVVWPLPHDDGGIPGTMADGAVKMLEPGMRVEVTGSAFAGGYAPTVRAEEIHIMGVEPLRTRYGSPRRRSRELEFQTHCEPASHTRLQRSKLEAGLSGARDSEPAGGDRR